MKKQTFLTLIALLSLIPWRALAVTTKCQVVNGILWCDTYKTQDDYNQEEADKYRNKNWNDEIIKPVAPAIPPISLPPTLTPEERQAHDKLNNALQQGTEQVYDEINKLLAQPKTKTSITPAAPNIKPSPDTRELLLEKLREIPKPEVKSVVMEQQPQPTQSLWGRIINFFKNLF
ncbi:MAG: hypothetical protein KGJ93_01515 [Patescibacteria group bacterium]|nr:hypothetical protein [Patescibacteria group bacterium]